MAKVSTMKVAKSRGRTRFGKPGGGKASPKSARSKKGSQTRQTGVPAYKGKIKPFGC